MEFKKNIVLTATDSNGTQKGILTYIKNNEGYQFEFKGINFLPKDRILGLYINDNLYKYNLEGKTLSFTIPIEREYLENVSVVVLDRQNMLKPFLWGSQLITDNDYILNKVIEEVNIKTIKENYENKEPKLTEPIQTYEIQEEPEEKQTFSFTENLSPIEEKFENNELRIKTLEKEQEEIEQLLDTYQEEIDSDIAEEISEPAFYRMVSSQVEKMLNSNETERILEEIIPDSKFVNIPKANGESYIFGIIYENNIPKYLCYGERGKFSEERPEHLRAYYQWLPIDVDNISGDGYFMMYQDAQTGKNLEMTVI